MAPTDAQAPGGAAEGNLAENAEEPSMQPQPGMGAHAQQPDADADASHALPWLQLPADAAQLLPELQQLYHTYQVEHAALLEQLHAQHQAFVAAGGKAFAAQPTPPVGSKDGDGDSSMAEAGPGSEAGAAQQQPGEALDGSWGSVRAFMDAQHSEGGGSAPAADASTPAAASQPTAAAPERGVGPAGEQQATTTPQAAAPTLQQQQQEHQQDEDAPEEGGWGVAREPFGDERLGRGSDGPPVAFADAERLLLQLQPHQVPAASPQQLEEWREKWLAVQERVVAQEQLASAVSAQWMDAQGALACLCGQGGRYLLRRSTTSLGRACDALPGEVDLDLSACPGGMQASRLQAAVRLTAGGAFQVTNMGRRDIYVNGAKVRQGESATLPHLALLEIASLKFLVLVNFAGVKRALARSSALVA